MAQLQREISQFQKYPARQVISPWYFTHYLPFQYYVSVHRVHPFELVVCYDWDLGGPWESYVELTAGPMYCAWLDTGGSVGYIPVGFVLEVFIVWDVDVCTTWYELEPANGSWGEEGGSVAVIGVGVVMGWMTLLGGLERVMLVVLREDWFVLWIEVGVAIWRFTGDWL